MTPRISSLVSRERPPFSTLGALLARALADLASFLPPNRLPRPNGIANLGVDPLLAGAFGAAADPPAPPKPPPAAPNAERSPPPNGPVAGRLPPADEPPPSGPVPVRPPKPPLLDWALGLLLSSVLPLPNDSLPRNPASGLPPPDLSPLGLAGLSPPPPPMGSRLLKPPSRPPFLSLSSSDLRPAPRAPGPARPPRFGSSLLGASLLRVEGSCCEGGLPDGVARCWPPLNVLGGLPGTPERCWPTPNVLGGLPDTPERCWPPASVLGGLLG